MNELCPAELRRLAGNARQVGHNLFEFADALDWAAAELERQERVIKMLRRRRKAA